MGGFEEKFADLDLNLGLKGHRSEESTATFNGSKRHKYPRELYPESLKFSHKTTRSKSPILSTALRAEARVILNPGQPSISKNPQRRIRSHHVANQGQQNIGSPAEARRATSLFSAKQAFKNDRLPLSFMKETSSSLQKHSYPPGPLKSADSKSAGIGRRNIDESEGKLSNRKMHPYRRYRSDFGGQQLNRKRASLMVSHVSDDSNGSKCTKIEPYDDKICNVDSKDSCLHSAFVIPSEIAERVDRRRDENQRTTLYLEDSSPLNSSFSQSFNSSEDDIIKSKQMSRDNKICTLDELLSIIFDVDSSLFASLNEIEDNCVDSKTLKGTDFYHENVEKVNGSLRVYERGEILRKNDVYYLPSDKNRLNDTRDFNIRNYGGNFGFDDENGNYIVIPHDHINYRYEILSFLGNGSFGNVMKCADHKFKNKSGSEIVAVKIVTNDMNWSLQAVSEIKMLKYLNEKADSLEREESNLDGEFEFPILRYYNHFHFRGHMCIVSELLSLNLYSLLEIVKFRGFSASMIKQFAKKIVKGIAFIHNHGVIHCDIKPENIMIKLPADFVITEDVNKPPSHFSLKIIDFGSSCFQNEIYYSYVQSRYYRAPEVIIGANYNNKIDIWSLGCVLAELYTGKPILPGASEIEQVSYILELFGAPGSQLVKRFRSEQLNTSKRQAAAYSVGDSFRDSAIDPIKAPPYVLKNKTFNKTLLYKLFDSEGKINFNFLTFRMQASNSNSNSLSMNRLTFRRNTVRLNSKKLDVQLRINSSIEDKRIAKDFLCFLDSIFKWDPLIRPSADSLLLSRFLND